MPKKSGQHQLANQSKCVYLVFSIHKLAHEICQNNFRPLFTTNWFTKFLSSHACCLSKSTKEKSFHRSDSTTMLEFINRTLKKLFFLCIKCVDVLCSVFESLWLIVYIQKKKCIEKRWWRIENEMEKKRQRNEFLHETNLEFHWSEMDCSTCRVHCHLCYKKTKTLDIFFILIFFETNNNMPPLFYRSTGRNDAMVKWVGMHFVYL